MKQVIQNFKTGELSVAEVPPPSLAPGFVLVRNHFSLISAGTERSTVATAQASLLGKARQRPDLVKQVLDTLKKEGLSETWKRVRTKLDSLKELGYSTAGTVLASMDTNGLFKPGDRVACGGGGYASHSGVVSVPQNLVVRVPDSVGLDHAAFTTLGAIAMQGVRQAEPRIGDSVCVIGLGLLGQLTAQILRANGCRVFGIDMADAMVELAEKGSCHRALNRKNGLLLNEAQSFTEGHGFDSVIITAAAPTADPIELSTELLRQKGRIVVVGAVPMHVPRDPHFYQKELELRISCSYGPGRYDRSYEEEGKDYPYGYVRWTENRNMGAFVRLLESGSVAVDSLVTHVIPIEEAERAYQIVTGKLPEPHIGILLSYPTANAQEAVQLPAATIRPVTGQPRIAFVGAGSFAQKFLIPHARAAGSLVSVATSRGITAKSAAEKFGFTGFTSDARETIHRDDVDAVFVATRHDSHAEYAIQALDAGKHVFVEKPLAIVEEDLERLSRSVNDHPGQVLMVGYNRRFSPAAREAAETFHGLSEPLIINYRVNAGLIPMDHWVQGREGGGRILGEVCHFVDLIQFLTQSPPRRVHAVAAASANAKIPSADNLIISMEMGDGSIASITYVAVGDTSLPKERIEILGGGMSMVINDFRSTERFVRGKRSESKKAGKGYPEEVNAFLAAIRNGGPAPIPFESLFATSLCTFRILDSLTTGLPQEIPPLG